MRFRYILNIPVVQMAIAGNPKKIAQDISDGFVSLSPPSLKRYGSADLKVVLTNIGIVQRETRALQIPQENVLQIKEKNMRLTRLNQAEVTLRSFCKKSRITI